MKNFKYLGTIISAAGTDEEEVRCRIGIAYGALYALGKTLRERRMGIKLRGRIQYTPVIAVLLHGCERWRLRKSWRRS